MNELEVASEKEIAIEVITLYSEGKTPSEIRNRTGVAPKVQAEMVSLWKDGLRSDRYASDRAKELIGQADHRYESIIKQMHEVVDESEDNKIRLEALKQIANVEKMRIEFFQRSGLINQGSISERVVEMEHQVEAVIGVLRLFMDEFSTKSPEAVQWIKQKLIELRGQAE